MGKIYILEDDKNISEIEQFALKNAGYEAEILTDFAHSVSVILDSNADLVLLDINIPKMNGEQVLRKLRQKSDVPVIMVTSRTEELDEVLSMSYGADDYITKPYQAPILLARIAAVLKRTRGNTEKTSYSYENVRLDLLKCTISCDEKEVELTKNEMKILHLLFMHAGNYVARQDLIESLWDNQIFIDDNTLSVHVTRIREKLRELGRDNFIQTKRGMGYRI